MLDEIKPVSCLSGEPHGLQLGANNQACAKWLTIDKLIYVDLRRYLLESFNLIQTWKTQAEKTEGEVSSSSVKQLEIMCPLTFKNIHSLL